MKSNIVLGSLLLGLCLSTPSFGDGLLDRLLGLKGSGCDSACCDTGCSADPSCGCETSDCDSSEPSCGCETAGGECEPSCGCETGCADASAPSCGCETGCADASAPSCGCEEACDPCGCSEKTRRPLLELLMKLKPGKTGCDDCCEPSCGCETACGDCEPSCGCETGCADACAPSCGCEVADACGCDSGCGKKKSCGGLLAKLFEKKSSCCDAGCDAAPTCGCESAGCSSGDSASDTAPAAEAAPMPPAPVVDPNAFLRSNRRVIQTSYGR